MNFSSLGLSDPILRAVSEQGYKTPSPVQAEAIPAILKGSDIMAAAQTGTGKTAGFTLPILERLSHGKPAKSNHVRALVLTPTRELAAQIADNVSAYSRHLQLRSAVVFGGVKINPQMMRLRKGADVLIATPGRLLDLAQQNAIRFDQLEILVLDEADRMLDMGFIRDIHRILSLLPRQRQTLMFSATFSKKIQQLAESIVKNPTIISVTPRNTTAQSVSQCVMPVDKKKKSELLKHLLFEKSWNQVLVFTRTKHGANKLASFLDSEGIPTAAFHGNKSQAQRTRALTEFKKGKVSVLVATDIAARGIDIDQLPQVVNFDLPQVPEDYVHRIGRTGRAGAVGEAVSLVSADERGQLRDIEKLIGSVIEIVHIEGFAPTQNRPKTLTGKASKTSDSPRKNKKRAPTELKRKNGSKPSFKRRSKRDNRLKQKVASTGAR